MKKYGFLYLILPFISLLSPFYLQSLQLSEEAFVKVQPYLLPDNFELKHELNQIFGKTRVILNSYTLEQAGFTHSKQREFSRLVVTSHPRLPGYIFKIYLDSQDKKPDETAQHFFIKRVVGSLAIQKFLDENHLNHLFKVPKKWIYLLPEVKLPNKKYAYKNFVLVEEDMNILDKKENKAAWASSQVTEEMLIGLYRILKSIGLIDCAKIDNIPFSEDGKIAFIDTETFGSDYVPFKRLKRSLSSEMRKFWTSITAGK